MRELLSKEHSYGFDKGAVMYILTLIFHSNLNFALFSNKMLPKLLHYIEKVLRNKSVDILSNFCMVIFSLQVINPFVLNHCSISIRTTIRFSLKNLKSPDDELILSKL